MEKCEHITELKYFNEMKPSEAFFTVNVWPYKDTAATDPHTTRRQISQLLWNEGTGDLLRFVGSSIFALVHLQLKHNVFTNFLS